MNNTQKDIIAIETVLRLLTATLPEDQKDLLITMLTEVKESSHINTELSASPEDIEYIFDKAIGLVSKIK